MSDHFWHFLARLLGAVVGAPVGAVIVMTLLSAWDRWQRRRATRRRV